MLELNALAQTPTGILMLVGAVSLWMTILHLLRHIGGKITYETQQCLKEEELQHFIV